MALSKYQIYLVALLLDLSLILLDGLRQNIRKKYAPYQAGKRLQSR